MLNSANTTLGITLNKNYVLTLLTNGHNARIYFDRFNPSKAIGFDLGYVWEPIAPDKIDNHLRPNMSSSEFIKLYISLSEEAIVEVRTECEQEWDAIEADPSNDSYFKNNHNASNGWYESVMLPVQEAEHFMWQAKETFS